MQHSTRLWLLALLGTALLSLAAVAQEKDGEEKESDKPAEAVKVAQAKADAEREKDATDADDYEASEEISEDLSVSYPIDI